MPHLETVAGEATERSSTSNIIVIRLVRGIIYPELRHNFLLSSSTVFIFSIQIASTGPSNMTQFLSDDSSFAHSCMIFAKIPSYHSDVAGSKSPYI